MIDLKKELILIKEDQPYDEDDAYLAALRDINQLIKLETQINSFYNSFRIGEDVTSNIKNILSTQINILSILEGGMVLFVNSQNLEQKINDILSQKRKELDKYNKRDDNMLIKKTSNLNLKDENVSSSSSSSSSLTNTILSNDDNVVDVISTNNTSKSKIFTSSNSDSSNSSSNVNTTTTTNAAVNNTDFLKSFAQNSLQSLSDSFK
jgi:hypothetical protein